MKVTLGSVRSTLPEGPRSLCQKMSADTARRDQLGGGQFLPVRHYAPSFAFIAGLLPSGGFKLARLSFFKNLGDFFLCFG